MMAAFASLGFISGSPATIGAGLLFGAAFGIVPLLTFWIAGLADDEERPRVVALGNSLFNGVTFLTAALTVALTVGDITAASGFHRGGRPGGCPSCRRAVITPASRRRAPSARTRPR